MSSTRRRNTKKNLFRVVRCRQLDDVIQRRFLGVGGDGVLISDQHLQQLVRGEMPIGIARMRRFEELHAVLIPEDDTRGEHSGIDAFVT